MTAARPSMRPPDQVTVEPATVATQPAGAVAETIAMPSGAVTASVVVAWGGRSFGVSKAISVLTPSSTNGGAMVTCALAAAGRSSARAAATRDEASRQAEVPGDHHPLNLVRALADLEDLLVAVQA